MPYRPQRVTHRDLCRRWSPGICERRHAARLRICICRILHYDKLNPSCEAGDWYAFPGASREAKAHDEMTSNAGNFILVLIMLALPLQSVLAAVMPLCSQASQAQRTHMADQPETRTHHSVSTETCSLHMLGDEETGQAKSGGNGNTTDMDTDLALSCDGNVCHISGNSLPPASSTLNFAGGFSYAFLSAVLFSSIIPQQPQRPPLA